MQAVDRLPCQHGDGMGACHRSARALALVLGLASAYRAVIVSASRPFSHEDSQRDVAFPSPSIAPWRRTLPLGFPAVGDVHYRDWQSLPDSQRLLTSHPVARVLSCIFV
jgi:hypothetical protein